MDRGASAMDHRWGRRVSVKCTVELVTPHGPIGTGVIDDVSLSGAFIRTSASIAPCTPLWIRISGAADDIRGFVTRVGVLGVGIEWLEPELALVKRFEVFHAPDSAISAPHQHSLQWQLLMLASTTSADRRLRLHP
jgi:hypothetical protein